MELNCGFSGVGSDWSTNCAATIFLRCLFWIYFYSDICHTSIGLFIRNAKLNFQEILTKEFCIVASNLTQFYHSVSSEQVKKYTDNSPYEESV